MVSIWCLGTSRLGVVDVISCVRGFQLTPQGGDADHIGGVASAGSHCSHCRWELELELLRICGRDKRGRGQAYRWRVSSMISSRCRQVSPSARSVGFGWRAAIGHSRSAPSAYPTLRALDKVPSATRILATISSFDRLIPRFRWALHCRGSQYSLA